MVQKFEVLLPYFIALVVSLEFTFSTHIFKVIQELMVINMSSALRFLVQKMGVSNMAYPEGLDQMVLVEEYEECDGCQFSNMGHFCNVVMSR